MTTESLAAMRLFQLISPSLPTGAFTYSQGLEWAVEVGTVKDGASLADWLTSLLVSAFQEFEIPLLKRLYNASCEKNIKYFQYWSSYTVACRETKELRDEEVNRGRAMAKLLEQLGFEIEEAWLSGLQQSQLAGFAYAAAGWNIDCHQAALGYTWGWLENMVMAAVKTVPLGQAAGQRTLADISATTTQVVNNGLMVSDENICGSCPAFAIASSLHETQYTRLFRS